LINIVEFPTRKDHSIMHSNYGDKIYYMNKPIGQAKNNQKILPSDNIYQTLSTLIIVSVILSHIHLSLC